MGEIKLKCRFLTPAFIYGDNNQLELRASSIKGLIRFWWRAVNEFGNIEEMRNEESEIFGGKLLKKGKEEFIKAKVQILTEIIKNNNKELKKSLLDEYEDYSGIKYLFYSIGINDKKNRNFFNKGTEFKVKFKFKDEDSKYVREYIKAFNTLQLFGGIGCRSRRGAGNFIVEEVEGDPCGISKQEILRNLYEEESGTDILEVYKKVFKENKSNCELRYSNIISESTKACLLSLNKKNLLVNNNYEDKPFAILKKLIDNFDFEENLDEIAEKYRIFRKETNYNKCNDRGASPLIIKVVKDREECKILLIKLSGERLEYCKEKSKLKKNSIGNENDKSSKEFKLNEEDKIVDEFLDKFIKENNKNEIEVINLRG
ncbi:type III-B CRISPR module RAMP protein Cmr1 [Clostridium scatologenes]|uniref:CRISPR-associated RAMP protein, Cmr1 family n=1 Tax=Clostridium scatologenes TaxID=1548 RepID=A0A0E3M7I2_CLOSL|nr:type III-B CRISPR module RAMP protein Cmr1 [Clostridium scatologenes]AKA67803.1 CRISPR-associated RAMP protein, Cmr1 family [Clostridium scatologenes]